MRLVDRISIITRKTIPPCLSQIGVLKLKIGVAAFIVINNWQQHTHTLAITPFSKLRIAGAMRP